MVESERPKDERAAGVQAYSWAVRVVSIAVSMAIPPLLGWALDSWLQWRGVLVALGGLLGLWLGIQQLLRLTGTPDGRSSQQASGQGESASGQDAGKVDDE